MKKLFILSLLCGLVSCSNGEKTVFVEKVSMPSGWNKDKPVNFRYTCQDTISKHNIYIVLRNDDRYKYSNIFLITRMESPKGEVVVDTLEYEMATPEGKWLGTGISYKTSTLFYKENVHFPEKGLYNLSIGHANRSLGKDDGVVVLEGITDVGVEIDKIK